MALVLYILIFFVHVAHSLPSPEDPASGCPLNFSLVPYEPSGECIGEHQQLEDWAGIATTRCCANVLHVLSLALAVQASNGKETNIFITKDQWKNCSGPFQRQPNVSADSCGFNGFFHGSSRCSSIALLNVTQVQNFQKVLDECGQFGASFDDACKNCRTAISTVRDKLLDQLGVKDNETEKAICSLALVISLVVKINNPPVIADLYRCLPTSNDIGTSIGPGPGPGPGPGTGTEEDYFKIKSSLAKVLLAIFLAATGLMLVIVLIKYVTRSSKLEKRPVPPIQIASCPGLYRFSKAEILNAINFGKARQCLGRGSAGQVFKGVLPSGQVVAIKQIHKSNTSDSFTRELQGLSRVRHPNLVSLFGCCIEDGDQYLVYEYCSSGNLAHHLLRKDTILTWTRRVKILKDCASALKYLHNHTDGCIVHRDIKLTNILLTENLEAKLSDFGLAKMLGMEESKVFTDVRGTIGYMDPEYMSNAKLTAASDIYSFGIVTLQVLSGQRVIELDFEARDQLIIKAKDVSIGKRPLKDFEDPGMNGNVNSIEFDSILQIAVLCVARSSKGRPSIDEVFQELDKAWRNTLADTHMAKAESSFATPLSTPFEVTPL